MDELTFLRLIAKELAHGRVERSWRLALQWEDATYKALGIGAVLAAGPPTKSATPIDFRPELSL